MLRNKFLQPVSIVSGKLFLTKYNITKIWKDASPGLFTTGSHHITDDFTQSIWKQDLKLAYTIHNLDWKLLNNNENYNECNYIPQLCHYYIQGAQTRAVCEQSHWRL